MLFVNAEWKIISRFDLLGIFNKRVFVRRSRPRKQSYVLELRAVYSFAYNISYIGLCDDTGLEFRQIVSIADGCFIEFMLTRDHLSKLLSCDVCH